MIHQKCQKCFETVAVPTRFKIFNYLIANKDGVTVNNLVKLTALRQPTVTFHIKELQRIGLLKKIRDGKEVYCYLNQSCSICPLFSN